MGAWFDSMTVRTKSQIGVRLNYDGSVRDVVYAPNKTKKDVKAAFEAYQREAAYEDGHSYSGRLNMCPGLEFHDSKIFPDYNSAENYLQEKCQKWENAIAVRYKDGDNVHWLIGGSCSC